MMNFVLLSVSYLSRRHLHRKYLCRNLVVAQEPQGQKSFETKNQHKKAQTRNKGGCLSFVDPAGDYQKEQV